MNKGNHLSGCFFTARDGTWHCVIGCPVAVDEMVRPSATMAASVHPAAPYRFPLPTRTPQEVTFLGNLEAAAQASKTSNVERFMHFPLWAPRQAVARFLAQWEVYKLVQDIHGSIVECGVAFGGGLMAWAHFLSITEPVAHTRRVIGFDTFEGFQGMGAQDAGAQSGLAQAGGMAIPLEAEIAALAALHDHNRAVGHIPRVELVKGDAADDVGAGKVGTIGQYVQDHPELVVAMLVLDFDVYKPTKAALRWLVPRIPPGGVILFDEVNCRDWPGETLAVREAGLLDQHRLRRCAYTSTMSYTVVE